MIFILRIFVLYLGYHPYITASQYRRREGEFIDITIFFLIFCTKPKLFMFGHVSVNFPHVNDNVAKYHPHVLMAMTI